MKNFCPTKREINLRDPSLKKKGIKKKKNVTNILDKSEELISTNGSDIEKKKDAERQNKEQSE